MAMGPAPYISVNMLPRFYFVILYDLLLESRGSTRVPDGGIRETKWKALWINGL